MTISIQSATFWLRKYLINILYYGIFLNKIFDIYYGMMINYGIMNNYVKDHFQQKRMHVPGGNTHKINNSGIYLMFVLIQYIRVIDAFDIYT